MVGLQHAIVVPQTFWRCYCAEDIRDENLVADLVEALCSEFGVDLRRPRLYMVISELMSNAIDHGILHLDSSIKDGADGFAIFLRERAVRLASLTGSGAVLDVQVEQINAVLLSITFIDCGDGFDFSQYDTDDDLRNTERTYGRGLAVLRHLCSSVTHFDGGRGIAVEFNLSA